MYNETVKVTGISLSLLLPLNPVFPVIFRTYCNPGNPGLSAAGMETDEMTTFAVVRPRSEAAIAETEREEGSGEKLNGCCPEAEGIRGDEMGRTTLTDKRGAIS
jgi:hypothetical protein